VFYQYAIFAERQYQVFLKSPDTIRFRIYMDRKNRELSEQRELLAKASHGSQAYHELSINQGKTEKLLKEDRKKFFEHNQTMSHFREQALEMFSRCLEAGDEHSSYAVMRFCSLWLANFDEEELQVKIQPMVARIASHKMVFLSHQLSARILKEDEKPSIGQLTLRSLILRMCREHPFHSLHQLYCLRQTQGLPTGGRRQSSRIEYASSQADREAAAADIFAILREDKEVQERVLDFERLCDASLEWAKYPVKKSIATSKRKGPYRIPDNIQIRNLKDIKVPVMTAHTPLDMSMRYDDCVWVARYESTFSTAGGVNLPKISICWGSDGKPYKQLVSIIQTHKYLSIH
jgi:serine-protein kinase ATM